jgi:hypothetical protein
MIIQPCLAQTPINFNVALPVDLPFEYSVRIFCGQRTCEAFSAIDMTLNFPDEDPLRITLRKRDGVIAQALSVDDRIHTAYRTDVRVLMHQIGTIILRTSIRDYDATVKDLWREALGLETTDRTPAGAWMIHLTKDFAICTGTPYSEAQIENGNDQAEQRVLRENIKRPALSHDMAPDHFRLPTAVDGVVTLPVFLSPKIPASGHARLSRIAGLSKRLAAVLSGITEDPSIEVRALRAN